MGIQFSRIAAAAGVLVAVAGAAPEASAQGTSLTLRGGLSKSTDSFPYAVSDDAAERLYDSKLGRGGFGEGHVTFATPMRGVSM